MTSKLPSKKHVNFSRSEGRYNWLNTKEVSAQYYFQLPHLSNDQIKELDLKLSFTVDIEKDYSYEPDSYTPLEVLYEIKSIYDSYWIHSGQKDVENLIKYLESIEEEQEKLRAEYRLEYAKAKVEMWLDEVAKATSDLEKYWN